MTGDDFRDQTASLLRTRYENVRTEIQLTAKKADICFEVKFGPRRTIRTAVECKCWQKSITRDDAKNIAADYQAAFNNKEIDELWIITSQTPAPGARDYIDSFEKMQLMTALEFEQSIIDFIPMITHLTNDFEGDRISNYFIPPKFYASTEQREDLHTHILKWLDSAEPKPIAIWGGYGMGKTSYARYLASYLSRKCMTDYHYPIPILINLGDFVTAPSIDSLISSQLTSFYGVRHFSSAAFNILNRSRRFVLIFDGFDEMKFAMAQNEFAYFSSELRKMAASNPRLILLGRPDVIESEEDARRLLSSTISSHDIVVRADDAPDFDNIRLSFFDRDQYLALVSGFLKSQFQKDKDKEDKVQLHLAKINQLDLSDLLERPVQAKMFAEIITDIDPSISQIPRFSLYDLFIKRILRREEEKAARKHLSIEKRLLFMHRLAWWLWTDKKTRTFSSLDIPLEIIQRFQAPGIELDALRRELLIGSIVEERNVGQFLSEKMAGIFYFPHTSFTEFLVSDYIISKDFIEVDIDKIPAALAGEVPTFLREHPTGDALKDVYAKIKRSKVAQNTQSLKVFVEDSKIRQQINATLSDNLDSWDVCLKYFGYKASHETPLARQLLQRCLRSKKPTVSLAALITCFYEEHSDATSLGQMLSLAVISIFRQIGVSDLQNAVARGGVATARSREINHFVEILNKAIKIIPREHRLTIDFNSLLGVTSHFIGKSCVIDDVIGGMRSLWSIERQRILSAIEEKSERQVIDEILRRGHSLNIVPTIAADAN